MPKILHNKSVQALSGWVGLMTFAYAVLGKLTPEWFGKLSWPQLILAALGCALVSALLLAITLATGAWAFRLVLPHSSVETPKLQVSTPELMTSYDDTEIKRAVAGLNKTVSAVIDDYQRMSGLEARFADETDGIKTAVQAEIEARQTAQQIIEQKINEALALSEKVEKIRVDTSLASRDIEKTTKIQDDYRKKVEHSLFAIGARERLATLEVVINRNASDLYDRLKAGEVYDAVKWQQWENVYNYWEAALNEWLDTGTWYAIAVKERTLSIDDAKYGLNWSVADNQFPDFEAARRFKKFRIVHQQWEEVRSSVKAGMDSVAFAGMTELDVRSGRNAG